MKECKYTEMRALVQGRLHNATRRELESYMSQVGIYCNLYSLLVNTHGVPEQAAVYILNSYKHIAAKRLTNES